MGCSASKDHLSRNKVTDKNGFNEATHNKVTDRDKHLIKKTWKIVSNDMPGIGAKIFLKIFTIKPNVKEIFPFRDVTGEDLLRDPHFRGHASRFMQAVGAAVDNINDLENAMTNLLFGLGQQHIHYKGFKAEYFDSFTVAIIQVLQLELGSKFTEDVNDAWSHVVNFMISNLKYGYTDALKKAGQ